MTRPPLNQTLVSVVLPVFNEAHVLNELLRRVITALQTAGVQQEIIFVNDGSTDASPRLLDRLARRHSQVRVIHFSRNFGHQAAVQAGLAHAQGDAVVLMDSDLQDDPEAIGRFLTEWQAGNDVVYAIRSERREQWWKRLLFAVFHRTMSTIASVNIPCDAGNFSLIDARLVRQIVELGECDRYLPGLRSWVGFKQQGVPVRRHARYDGKPRVSLTGLWRLAKTAIFSFSSFPLTLFYFIGYSSLAVFAALSSYSLVCKLFTTLAVPGWTSQVLVASFFGAVNSLGICVLGEYVMRIYDQVRGRPLYIVDRIARQDAPGISSDDLDASHEMSLVGQTADLIELAQAAVHVGTADDEADSNERAVAANGNCALNSDAISSADQPAVTEERWMFCAE
jgi:polyisoprenyl-phosphate glycosyltransferase